VKAASLKAEEAVLAVKILRQRKNIALLGAPTSAAAQAGGHEREPAALRAAGLAARLTAAGFTVIDHGDCATRVFATDDEHPRARNVAQVLAVLEELRPKIEAMIKSGALPLILGGDNSIALAAIAASRRYYKTVSLVYLDRDASLNVPAATPTGSMDAMVLSHVTGRGAPELVRFWGEPPLVREHEVALFGYDRLDEAEQKFLLRSNLRRCSAEEVASKGPAEAARQALESVHGHTHEFVLHCDVDVIAGEDFAATNLSAPGGLRIAAVREALRLLARQETLAAFSISAYNPNLDADGTAAQKLIDLLVDVLSARLEGEAAQEPASAAATSVSSAVPAAPEAETKLETAAAEITAEPPPDPDQPAN
jgi:arginase